MNEQGSPAGIETVVSSAHSARSSWLRVALAVLLLWAAVVRIWYGSPDPDSSRFWDERFAVENIMGVLAHGDLKPRNGFHPSLSYLPQLGVLAASQQVARWTGLQTLEVLGPRGFTSTAYLLCRWTQAIFGVLSLWLVFLIGRRLFDEPTAVLAVALLATMPWHIRQSAVFKPDIQLVLTLLLAFLLSLRAVEAPSLHRFLAAGGAIGLALSAKFNAGPIAIPLAVGGLTLARRHWRALLWLGAAGFVALGTFLALNPYVVLEPQIYTSDFSRTLTDYAHKGATRARGSHLLQFVHFARSTLSSHFLGPVIGIAAILAPPLLAGLLLRHRVRDGRVLGGWMLLSYIVGYSVLYAISTANPSAHNWLPLAPFTSLLAAWLLVAAWRALRSRVPALSARPVGIVPVLVLGPWLLWTGTDYAYRKLIPSTAMAAGNHLKREMPHFNDRVVISEAPIPGPNRRRGMERLAQLDVPRLSEVEREILDAADVELFLASRLDSRETSPFYAQRVRAAQGGYFERFPPRLFHVRGPELVMLIHPYRPVQKAVRGQLRRIGAGRYEVHPPGGRGRWISLRVAMPRKVRADSISLRASGRAYECVENQTARDRWLWLCPRVRRVSTLRIEVWDVTGGSLPRHLEADVMGWSRRRPQAQAGSGSRREAQP